jgi:coatomer subunit beta'
VAAAVAAGEPLDSEGIEEAFDVEGEIQEVVKTGVWVGDCFLYTSAGLLTFSRFVSSHFGSVGA